MSKIIGNTTTTPVPRSDWEQTDKKKADYIRNKPTLGTISEKDAISRDDLTQEVQSSIDTKASVATVTTAEYTALEEAEATNANTLYIITDAEEETPNAAQIQANWDETDEASPSYIRNKPDENDALLLVTEMGLVQPVSTASGDILTDNNNNIIIL